MLNFSGETMLVGLSSMPRGQSEMLTCVKACPGSSRVHFKAAPEYVVVPFKIDSILRCPLANQPRSGEASILLAIPSLRFSCCWDPFLAFRVRFRSSRT